MSVVDLARGQRIQPCFSVALWYSVSPTVRRRKAGGSHRDPRFLRKL